MKIPETPTHEDKSPTSLKCGYLLLYLAVVLEAAGATVQPPLADVKAMITSCASQVQVAIDTLPSWDLPEATPHLTKSTSKAQNTKSDDGRVHHQMLSLLSSAIERMQVKIYAHLACFESFEFLWSTRKEDAYDSFMQQSPSLEDAEFQVRRLNSLQQEIDAVPEVICVDGTGVGLETAPLKHAVRAEISSWKTEFSKTLHRKAFMELKALEGRYSHLVAALGREVEDITDVAAVVHALQEAREEELDFDRQMTIVEEMYAFMESCAVPLPKEELCALGDLQYAQRSVCAAIQKASAVLSSTHDAFVSDVKENAIALVKVAASLRAQWDSAGPAVPGLAPLEAAERLAKFKNDFEASVVLA